MLGQRLFHARGYEAVGLAMLTDALGINPPSFYAAFGSKAAFFARILDRYAASVIPLRTVLAPGRPAAEALTELLVAAARTYAADAEARGCLVLEAARSGVGEGSVLARQVAEKRRTQLRDFVASHAPDRSELITDYICTVMSGLSAQARHGLGEARLLAVAQAAAQALPPMLAGAAYRCL